MAGVSDYERSQLDALLGTDPLRIVPCSALLLMPDLEAFHRVCEIAVAPALEDNGLIVSAHTPAFTSTTHLPDVAIELLRAEVIVADVSGPNADVLYVLGLCHGLRRSPLLISQRSHDLPFHLQVLRCMEYTPTVEGLRRLREQLTRATRIFLAASRATNSG